jgi:hypothetical protein
MISSGEERRNMRVTCDLDNPTEFESLKVFFNMSYLFRDHLVETRRSKGGNGYHLIVRGLPISLETSVSLRRTLGDDSYRAHLDSMHLVKPKNVLFNVIPGRSKLKVVEYYDERFEPPFLTHEDTLIDPRKLKRRVAWIRRWQSKFGRMQTICSRKSTVDKPI